jgi:hypothetical protein
VRDKPKLKKHIRLDQSGQNEEAIVVMKNYRDRIGQSARDAIESVDDGAIERCGTAGAPLSPEQVATALIERGVMLGQSSQGEEAIAVYEDVVQRFGSASGRALRELVAQALFREAILLNQLGRTGQEIAVYEDLIRRFGAAGEPGLRDLVARGSTTRPSSSAKPDAPRMRSRCTRIWSDASATLAELDCVN